MPGAFNLQSCFGGKEAALAQLDGSLPGEGEEAAHHKTHYVKCVRAPPVPAAAIIPGCWKSQSPPPPPASLSCPLSFHPYTSEPLNAAYLNSLQRFPLSSCLSPSLVIVPGYSLVFTFIPHLHCLNSFYLSGRHLPSRSCKTCRFCQ